MGQYFLVEVGVFFNFDWFLMHGGSTRTCYSRLIFYRTGLSKFKGGGGRISCGGSSFISLSLGAGELLSDTG